MGFPHPDYLLRSLTAVQIAEWEAYYRLEPWGFHAENHRVGLLASVVANFSFSSKKRDFVPSDWFPPQQKPESLAVRIMKLFGVPVRRRHG